MSTRPHTTFLICNYSLLTGVEVFCPKAINIKQYLNTNSFSINNKHFVIQFFKIFKIGFLDPDMKKKFRHKDKEREKERERLKQHP